MIQFYSPDITETLTLPESDSAHAARVLRLKAGDLIQVIDGKGTAYTCRIVAPHQRHTLVEITDSRATVSYTHLTLPTNREVCITVHILPL